MRNPINTSATVEAPRENIYNSSREYKNLYTTNTVQTIRNIPSNPLETSFELRTSIPLDNILSTDMLSYFGSSVPVGYYTPVVGIVTEDYDLSSWVCYVNTQTGLAYPVKDLGVNLSNCSIVKTCAPDNATDPLLLVLGGFSVPSGDISSNGYIIRLLSPISPTQSSISMNKYIAGNLVVYNKFDSSFWLFGGIFSSSSGLNSTQSYLNYEEDLADHWTHDSYSVVVSGVVGNYTISVNDITGVVETPNTALTTGSTYSYPDGVYGGHTTYGTDGYNYIVAARKAVNSSGIILPLENTAIYSIINDPTQNEHSWDSPLCSFPSGLQRTLPVIKSDVFDSEIGFVQSNGLYYYYSSRAETVSYVSLIATEGQQAFFSSLYGGLCYGVTSSTRVTKYNVYSDFDNTDVVIVNAPSNKMIEGLGFYQAARSPALPTKAGVMVPDYEVKTVTSPNTGTGTGTGVTYTKTYLTIAPVYIQLGDRVIPERPKERARIRVSNIGEEYDNVKVYTMGDVVTYNGGVYLSTTYSNVANTPDASPRYEWIDINDPSFNIPNPEFFSPKQKWDSTVDYLIDDEVVVPELGLVFKAVSDNTNEFPLDSEGDIWANMGPVNEYIPFDDNPATIFELPDSYEGVVISYGEPQSIIKGIAGVGINGGLLEVTVFSEDGLVRESEKSIIDESKDNFIHLFTPDSGLHANAGFVCGNSSEAIEKRLLEVVITRPSYIMEEPFKLTNLITGKYYPFGHSEFSASVQRKVKTTQKTIDQVATIAVPDAYYDVISGSVRFDNLVDYQRAIRDLNRAVTGYSVFYGGCADYEFSHILSYGLIDYSTTASDPATNSIKVTSTGVASVFTSGY